MFSVFKKDKNDNTNLLVASEYDHLYRLYKLEKIEIYIERFDINNEAINLFRVCCLNLQFLKIYKCESIRFYSSKILSLDTFKPDERLLEFFNLTRKCLEFIYKRKVIVLASGDVFNHNKHLGLKIKSASNFRDDNRLKLINSIVKTKNKTKKTKETNYLNPVIADFINRVNRSKSNVYINNSDQSFLVLSIINKNIYKMKMNLIKPFLNTFIKSEYCKDNIIQSIECDGKKIQVIIVTEEFEKLME